MNPATPTHLSRQRAVKFIVLFGIVSLFADMTYEGARAITGPYLAILGASAAVVGIVSGLGELLGYALRLGSGYLSDRTGRYWTITIIGYAINVFAVPLLAFTGRWETAAALILLERTGKAIRNPSANAMLAHAASQTGLGWGFGLHEAMDQAGAVIGPLAVTAILYFHGSYKTGFAALAVPAVLTVGTLLAACIAFPKPQNLSIALPDIEARSISHRLWIYLLAVACIAAGYVDFPLIAYHLEKTSAVNSTWIPIFYSLAMISSGIAAFLLGKWFDRYGMRTMIGATLLSMLAAPLSFFGGPVLIGLGMICWGIGMGTQGSIMLAVIAALTPANRRATAYGAFNAAYGLAWFAGSVALGVIYDHSILALVVLSVVLQAASLPILWTMISQKIIAKK